MIENVRKQSTAKIIQTTKAVTIGALAALLPAVFIIGTQQQQANAFSIINDVSLISSPTACTDQQTFQPSGLDLSISNTQGKLVIATAQGDKQGTAALQVALVDPGATIRDRANLVHTTGGREQFAMTYAASTSGLYDTMFRTLTAGQIVCLYAEGADIRAIYEP